MKLHLPKLLRSALLAVFVAPAMAVTLTTENIQTPVEGGSSYLNVGMENATDTWNGDLVVGDTADSAGDVDNVGAFNDSWGWVTPDGGKTNTNITSGLKVSGNLTVQGSGKVVLGGQYKGGGSYTGLEATESITVTGGTLTSTKIVTKNLNVSGGTVSTSTANCTSGNGYAAGPKQSYIKESLTVSGGSVSFGYTANVQGIGGGGHRMTAFGSSSNFTVNQTGGTLRVYGDMDMKSGSTITQTAGTMVLRDTIYMGGSGTTTINQSGDTSKLVLGRLETTGTLAGSCVFDISQTGAGLIHLAYGSNFAKASTINLTQSGSGAINIGGGHDTGITGALPSRGYELNNSPFEANNTTYNINQTAGTITLKTNALVMAEKTDIGGVLDVKSGATFGTFFDDATGAADAPIKVATGGSWTMAEGSDFGLTFTDEYLYGLDESRENADTEGVIDFDFHEKVAEGADASALKNGFVMLNMDERLWSLKEGTTWVQDGSTTYVDGTLVFDSWIDLTEGGTSSEVFSDVNSTLKVGLKISGKNTTLKGNNTHSYGTVIEGGEGLTVTLGHANALGAGAVSTSGTVTLATSGKIVANLPGTITNTGALTLQGSYSADSGNLVKLGEVEEAYLCEQGEWGEEGFLRQAGYQYQVVKNEGDAASLTVADGTSITIDGVACTIGANGASDIKVDYTKYYLRDGEHSAVSSEVKTASGGALDEIVMSDGELTIDDTADVHTTGGKLVVAQGGVVGGLIETETEVEAAGGTIEADIKGTSSLTVTKDTTLSGSYDYTGGTVINGAELKLEAGADVGTGAVELTAHGTFDMGGNALTNYIKVTGCTLRNAGAYAGDMDVYDALELDGATTANKVTLIDGGSITGDALTVNELDVQTAGDATVAGDLTINDNGTVTLNNGKVLTVGGSLTLAGSTTLALNGDYAVGTSLLTGTGSLTLDPGSVTLDYDDTTVELEQQGNSLVLVSKFKQDKADIAVQGNWGIATASRAFVNTVRGQHSNTGCIANGRGTVWAAAFGAFNDLDGSDINVKGAAVGVDAKVGSCSTVGIALGYTDGEVQPAGMRDVDQEGTYIALYGEHGLKKLSSTSCLSLDWVAAYGNTESDWNGTEWEQDSLQLNTRLNWNKKLTDRLCMSVFGGLEYFATDSDTVNGVKTGSIQNLRGELGVGARYVAWGAPGVYDGKGGLVSPGGEKLVLHGEVRYMNDMVRNNPVVRMNGLSGSSANPGRQGVGIEAGATYRISDRWSASANYGYNAMEDSREHRVNVGASYTF